MSPQWRRNTSAEKCSRFSLTSARWIPQTVSSPIWFLMLIFDGKIIPWVTTFRLPEQKSSRPAVLKDRIVYKGKSLRRKVSGCPAPNYFRHKVFFAKYLIHRGFEIVSLLPV